MSKHLNKTYGPYTVLRHTRTDKHHGPSSTSYVQWFKVQCTCGRKFEMRLQHITRVAHCTHDPMAALPHANLFHNIHDRCTNPNNSAFKYYGAKGVKVCDRWSRTAEGLRNFLADMGPRPSPDHSVDRRNPYGDYEPANCRWATSSEQNTNKRYRMSRRVRVPVPRKKTVFRQETLDARRKAKIAAEEATQQVRKVLDVDW